MAATAKPKKAKAPAKAVEPVEVAHAFKAFNKDLACNPNGKPFQYAVGQTYKHKGRVGICDQGFHACEAPLDVLNYYPLIGSRFAKVTLAGKLDRETEGDSKICGGSITIVAELALPAFIKEAAAWILKAAKGNTATGYRGHAAATGDRGHAAATGDSGHAAATGYRGHAAATGYRGHAAATGDSGHAAATGDSGIAASLGAMGRATAGKGGAVMLAHWDTSVFPWKLTRVGAFMVGQDGVEAGKTYTLSADGKPVEAA